MSESLPAGWKFEPLGQLAQVVSGGTPSRYVPAFWEGGSIPWVTPTDITGTSGRFLSDSRENITDLGLRSCSAKKLPPGTLLMTSRATLGEVKIALCEVCTNQGFKSLIPFKGVDEHYLYYQIGLNKERYKSFGIGSTFLEVNKRDTERFELLVAPEKEQHRIAEILSTVDEAIEQTEALIAKYQQIKAGLMHDLFTRGVTSDGRLRPTRADAPHLYKESPLGWIPKEWDVKPLWHFVPTATYGVSVSMSEDSGGVPVLRMNNIGQGRIDVADLKFSRAPEIQTLLLKPGDVLFNRTNSIDHVGKTAIWRGELPVASFASYLVRLDVDQNKIRPLFLAMWLNSRSTQIGIRRFATPGVHQVNINPTNLRRIECAVPRDLVEQDLITGQIEQLESSISSNEQGVAKLRQQKQGLMHDLLTGRVRVQESGQATTSVR